MKILFKNFVLSLLVLSFFFQHTFAQNLPSETITPRPLTLSKAIEMGLNHQTYRRQKDTRIQRNSIKKGMISERSIKHKVYSNLKNYNNEVADSTDVEASATNTNVVVLGYRQNYEGGTQVDLTTSQRDSQALTTGGTDETLTKQTLSVTVPFTGQAANLTRLSNQKEMETILFDQAQDTNFELERKIEIATTFLNLCKAQVNFQKSQNTVKLTAYSQRLKKAAKYRRSELDEMKFNLENSRAIRQRRLDRDKFVYQQRRLSSLIGRFDPEQQLDCEIRIPLTFNRSSMKNAYAQESVEMKKFLLKKQQQAIDLEISDSATSPDFSIGGFVGNSATETESGSNLGAQVSLSYSFGGGEEEKLQSQKLNLILLEDEEQELKERLSLDAGQDFNEYESAYAFWVLQKRYWEIADKDLRDSEKMGKLSQISKIQKVKIKQANNQAEAEAELARLDFHLVALKIISKAKGKLVVVGREEQVDSVEPLQELQNIYQGQVEEVEP